MAEEFLFLGINLSSCLLSQKMFKDKVYAVFCFFTVVCHKQVLEKLNIYDSLITQIGVHYKTHGS